MKIKIVEVFATKEAAEIFVAEYLDQYPSAGYDTSLRIEEEKDTWVVRGYRYSSCD